MEGEVGAKSDWGSGEEGQGRGIHHWICPNDFWIYGLKLSLCKRIWDKVQFWCSGLQHVLTGKGRERRWGDGEHKDRVMIGLHFLGRMLLRLICGSDVAWQKEVRRIRIYAPRDCFVNFVVDKTVYDSGVTDALSYHWFYSAIYCSFIFIFLYF